MLRRLIHPGNILGITFLVFLGLLFLIFPNPENLLENYSLITPLAFLAATLANATALGGGFLFIPLFIFMYGLSSVSALKLSLATQAFGMTAGVIGWSTKNILWPALRINLCGAIPGMLVGTFFYFPDANVIKITFAIISLIAAIAIIVESKWGGAAQRESLPILPPAYTGIFLCLSFFAGMLNAWVAIAMGEFVVLWLLFLCKIRIEKAIATGVASLAICSILGFISHIFLGGIPWAMLMFSAPAVLAGGYTGAKLGAYLEKRHQTRNSSLSPLRLIFVIILLIDSFIMLYK
ncbi:MAG: sulfite exporter TauE/SafE family protein [Pseudomonadota bacterium]